MKHLKSILIHGLILVCLASCSKEEVVTINKEYVINPNWNKVSNSIQFERMYVQDSTEINLSQVKPSELVQKSKTDTSFAFVANVSFNGVDYSERKVYFNTNNGFKWRKRPDLDPSRSLTFTTIGKLETETWYLLAGLSNIRRLYYIYVDSIGGLHQYKVPAAYWTNI